MRIDDGIGPLVELAASRHNAFHTNEAAEVGINSRRLRRARASGLLVNLYPSVWSFPHLRMTQAQAIRAATLVVPGSAAGFGSAAWLHGWVDRAPRLAEVWMPSGSRPRAEKVSVHRAANIDPDRDLIELDHITTLNQAATLCLLGAVAPRLLVEKCLDEFLRNRPEAWLDGTLKRLAKRTSRGPAVLNSIRNDPKRVVGMTDSWLERVVAGLVNLPGTSPPVLQYPVEVQDRMFRLDLAWPELKLGIETHSRSFHFGVGKEDADNVRELLLATAGWKVIYVTYSQLLDPSEFVRQVARVARARGQQLGRSSTPTGPSIRSL